MSLRTILLHACLPQRPKPWPKRSGLGGDSGRAQNLRTQDGSTDWSGAGKRGAAARDRSAIRAGNMRPGGPVLGLVGKAVTFDTGGISIKPANNMEKMKYDMGGGATMLGAMRALARIEAHGAGHRRDSRD